MPSATPAPLSRRGRVGRLSASSLLFGLVTWGAFFGLDSEFPFGPFRMYATASKPGGVVRVAALRAEWRDGTRSAVQPEEIGLRRAEFEGQLERFRSDPALLGAIAHRFTRPGKQLAALVLEQRGRRVVDGVVQPGREVRDVARWDVP